MAEVQHDEAKTQAVVQAAAKFIAFIPSRVIALGYLVVGNFSRALPVWLEHLFQYSTSAELFIAKVARAADDAVDGDAPEIEKVASQVNLAKRTVSLLTVLIAGLTLFGALN